MSARRIYGRMLEDVPELERLWESMHAHRTSMETDDRPAAKRPGHVGHLRAERLLAGVAHANTAILYPSSTT